MKKLILSFRVSCILLLLAAGLSSCQKEKEGVYNPKKKISKIYVSNDGVSGKVLRESWTWDKDELKQIDYYYPSGTLFGSDYLTYDDNKRLIEYTDRDGKITRFFYDKGKFIKFESYRDGTLLFRATVREQGRDKITKMLYEYFTANDPEKKDSEDQEKFIYHLASVMRFLNPGNCRESITEDLRDMCKQAADSKSLSYVTYVEFIYNNNNVMQEIQRQDLLANVFTVFSYTYDQKKNPFYHTFSESKFVSSESNITSMKRYSYLDEYEYEYDGEWPVRVLSKVMVQHQVSSIYYHYEYK